MTVRVPSLSRPGASYDVAVEDVRTGRLSCTCPAYSFTAKARRECKHIRVVRAAMHAAATCRAAGHVPAPTPTSGPNRLCFACLVLVLAHAAAKVARDYKPRTKRQRREL